MTSNLHDLRQDIQSEVDKLLDFVTGEEAQSATVDHIERGLFRSLLKLGAKLLLLFFATRAQNGSREPLPMEDGQEVPYHSEKKRTHFSVFGKLPFWRPYCYKSGVGGQSPLDAELSLGSDCYSDFLREMAEYLGVYVAYHKATDLQARFFDLEISNRVLQQIIDTDSVDVEAFYTQKPPPSPKEEADILVIQADGKGVPMVLETPVEPRVRLGKGEKRGRKKEAMVTSVCTIASAPRTPEEVVARYFQQAPKPVDQTVDSKRPKPQNKQVWATLQGKDVALARLAKQVVSRQGDHIRDLIALCDGCEALQTHIEACFSAFTLILDLIHADEYVWKVANSLLGETNEQRTEWVAQRALQMLSGKTEQIIAEFRCLAQEPKHTVSQREQLTQTANYFERDLPYMDYPTYPSKGWPIASG